MKEKIKIILDTDIGDDIDDAFALQYAVNHPDIELLGVTTVYKNVYQRACIAKRLLELNGRADIGVYTGENLPLKEPLKPFLFETRNADGTYNLLSWEKSLAVSTLGKQSAVEFILRTVEEMPNEVVLVGIGPMTNIAKAILAAPETMKKVKSILLMCGNIGAVYEWNIMCDPEAASIVLGSGLPIACVGSNCTERCYFEQTDLLECLSRTGPSASFINSMLRDWIVHNMRPPVMHDGLALSEVLHKFVHYQRCDIEVPLHDARRGMTICTENKEGAVGMSADFDRKGFMQHFREICLRAELKENVCG